MVTWKPFYRGVLVTNVLDHFRIIFINITEYFAHCFVIIKSFAKGKYHIADETYGYPNDSFPTPF